MGKSSKMYGHSPVIKRGDDGIIGVMKPSLATMIDMGLEDNSSEMPIQLRHVNDRMEMHNRHVSEKNNMYARHQAGYAEAIHNGTDMSLLTDKHVGEHADASMRQLQEIKDMLSRHMIEDKD